MEPLEVIGQSVRTARAEPVTVSAISRARGDLAPHLQVPTSVGPSITVESRHRCAASVRSPDSSQSDGRCAIVLARCRPGRTREPRFGPEQDVECYRPSATDVRYRWSQPELFPLNICVPEFSMRRALTPAISRVISSRLALLATIT